jgi:regulator of sirC expression with transglutaminase-like and TPR domain
VGDRARERFAQIVDGPEAGIDVAEAALWIAAEARPGLDVAAYRARLAALAERARLGFAGAGSGVERARSLTRFLHDEVGLRGNRDDYYDPCNSYLCDVLDRGLGIPITLSIAWIDVARRLGLRAEGVAFPGHFLVLVEPEEPEPEVVVDPFFGRLPSERECRALLAQAFGGGAAWRPELLAAARPREILARLLRNLLAIHARRGELASALACCDRIALVDPDGAGEMHALAAELRQRLRRLH